MCARTVVRERLTVLEQPLAELIARLERELLESLISSSGPESSQCILMEWTGAEASHRDMPPFRHDFAIYYQAIGESAAEILCLAHASCARGDKVSVTKHAL